MASKSASIKDVVYSKDRINDKQELDACIFAEVINPPLGILFSGSIKDLYSIFCSSLDALTAASLPVPGLFLLPGLFGVFSNPGSLLLSYITILPNNI